MNLLDKIVYPANMAPKNEMNHSGELNPIRVTHSLDLRPN